MNETSQSIQLSKFTHNVEVGKSFKYDPEIVQSTNGVLTYARVTTLNLPHIHDIAGVIEHATGYEHLTSGVCGRDEAACYSTKRAKELNDDNVVCRDNKHFKPPNSGNAGIMLLDSDNLDDNNNDVRGQFIRAIPELADYACVETTSSSSNITLAFGHQLRGLRGKHTYYAVKDPKDIKRALKVLHQRLIINGLGNHQISGTGAFLERSAVDLMLASASQPIYLKPNLDIGMTQDKAIIKYDGLPVIDTRKIFKKLSEPEQKAYEMVAQMAQDAMAQECGEVREKWLEGQSDKDSAKKALSDNTLEGDFLIYTHDGPVTVKEILHDPEKYHGKTCRDPFEPEYAGFTVAKIYSNQSPPIIHTNAHGGDNYRLFDLSSVGFGPTRVPVTLGHGVVNSGLAIEDAAVVDGQTVKPAYEIDNPLDAGEWHQEHLVPTTGKPYSTLYNFKRMLYLYGINVAYDLIGKQLAISGPGISYGSDDSDNANFGHINSLCKLNKIEVGVIEPYLFSMMVENEFNPVEQWIRSKPWDGVDRIDELFNTLDLAEHQDKDIALVMFKKWFIGSLRIGLGQIEKFEFVLILQASTGGEGKTRWFNKLCPSQWQIDGMNLNVEDKDKLKECSSHWLVELGELDSTFRKSEIKSLMSYLSRSRDEIRLPYARKPSRYKRRTAFFGTVNKDEFLIDDSGDRRFWPIALNSVNYEHNVDMQQFWAQIDTIGKEEVHWLDKKENMRIIEANKSFKTLDPLDERLINYFASAKKGNEIKCRTVTDILKASGIDYPTKAQLNFAGGWLRSKGYKKCQAHGMRGYNVPVVVI